MAAEPRRIGIKEEELRILRFFLWIVTIIAGFYLLGQIWGVLSNFFDLLLLLFLAWLLSFILEPWVIHLTKFGLPRVGGAAIVYLFVAAIVGLAGLIFVPLLAEQTSSFIAALALASREPPAWVLALQSNLSASGVMIDLAGLVAEQTRSFQAFSVATLSSTISLAAGLFSILFNALLVLLFSFYFVVDGDRIWKTLLAHLPAEYHDELLFVKKAIDASFAGFLRTQVLLGILSGILTFLVLLIFGTPYAVTAATFAGLIMVIPVIGAPLSLIPPVLVVLVTQPNSVLLVFLILLILQTILVNVIAPILFERSIGLHPVLVLISFLLGFKLAGGWGAIFAVPIAGVILLIGSQLLRHWFGPGRSVPELDWPL